jgi:hypothetical protein
MQWNASQGELSLVLGTTENQIRELELVPEVEAILQ